MLVAVPIEICTFSIDWQINVAVISIYARGFFGRKASDGGCMRMQNKMLMHWGKCAWRGCLLAGADKLWQQAPAAAMHAARQFGAGWPAPPVVCNPFPDGSSDVCCRSALLASLPRLTFLALGCSLACRDWPGQRGRIPGQHLWQAGRQGTRGQATAGEGGRSRASVCRRRN